MLEFILGLVILMGFGFYIKSIINKRKQQAQDKGVLLSALNCNYIGGFRDINGGVIINIIVYKDKIEFTKTFNTDIYNNTIKTIYINDIKNVGIQSETQIQSNINLGKLFVFGILAFGMNKDSKTTVKNYLVINFKQGNEVIDVVLDTYKNEELVKLISNIKRNL